MPKTQPNYDDNFKAKALKRVQAGEKVNGVAKDLGVHFGSIYKWMKDAGIDPKEKKKTNGAATVAPRNLPSDRDPIADRMRDATLYLRHARTAILKEGKMTRSNLLSLLALDALEGE